MPAQSAVRDFLYPYGTQHNRTEFRPSWSVNAPTAHVDQSVGQRGAELLYCFRKVKSFKSYKIMINENQTIESATRVMNPSEVQAAYDRRMKELSEDGTRNFRRFSQLRSEACKESNRATRDIKHRIHLLQDDIHRLEMELIDVAEKRANLIHEARQTYEARCTANREARAEARMQYTVQMMTAKSRKNALPDGE